MRNQPKVVYFALYWLLKVGWLINSSDFCVVVKFKKNAKHISQAHCTLKLATCNFFFANCCCTCRFSLWESVYRPRAPRSRQHLRKLLESLMLYFVDHQEHRRQTDWWKIFCCPSVMYFMWYVCVPSVIGFYILIWCWWWCCSILILFVLLLICHKPLYIFGSFLFSSLSASQFLLAQFTHIHCTSIHLSSGTWCFFSSLGIGYFTEGSR